MYIEDDLLPLSGLQHMAFCERQCALIHIEQLWEENRLTAEGRLLHERVHEQTEETRHGLITVRGLPVRSLRLGVSGQADVVEFSRAGMNDSPDSLQLVGREGWWQVKPVEFKRGKAKPEACDRVQLCAQALCLEEMFGVSVPEGALFYGTPRRRTEIQFDAELRRATETLAARMHVLIESRVTPHAVLFPGCRSCSLKQQCLPETAGLGKSVSTYYKKWISRD